MLQSVLKVDKLCTLKFVIVIAIRAGSSFITSELGGFELSVFSRTNSCKFLQNLRSCQWVWSTAQGTNSSNHKILRKLNFSVRISYLLPTSHERLIEALSEKYNFSIKIK